MILKNNYPSNFKNLILSRSLRNIADSFYLVAINLGLVVVYNIDASNLSLFVLIGMLPSLLSVFYGSLLSKIKNTRLMLLCSQVCQVFIIVAIILCLFYKWNVGSIYVLNFLFALSTNILNIMQTKIVPESLENDIELINKSVDIQYFVSNSLDIISNFVASLLLAIISYLYLMALSIPFFVATIYFVFKIKLRDNYIEHQVVEDKEDDENDYKKLGLKKSIKIFMKSKETAGIITIEGFLSGGTDLLLALIPLYLIQQNFSIQYLGLVLAVHKGADLLGAVFAPKIVMDSKKFFFIDYLISGTCLLLVFLIPNKYIKLFLFFIAFVIIGISGNIFNKMIYEKYEGQSLTIVFTVISSIYSFFGIFFMLIPQVYNNIVVLGIAINSLTVIFGIIIMISYLKKDRA